MPQDERKVLLPMSEEKRPGETIVLLTGAHEITNCVHCHGGRFVNLAGMMTGALFLRIEVNGQTVTVANIGTEPAIAHRLPIGPAFNLDCDPVTLQPGEKLSIAFHFNPSDTPDTRSLARLLVEAGQCQATISFARLRDPYAL